MLASRTRADPSRGNGEIQALARREGEVLANGDSLLEYRIVSHRGVGVEARSPAKMRGNRPGAADPGAARWSDFAYIWGAPAVTALEQRGGISPLP